MSKRTLADRLKRDSLIFLAALNTMGATFAKSPSSPDVEKNPTEIKANTKANSMFNTPVTEDTRQFGDDQAAIGSIVGEIILKADGKTKDQRLKQVKKSELKKAAIVAEQRTAETLSDLAKENQLAFARKDTIHMAKYTLSENLKQQLVQKLKENNDSNYLTDHYIRLNNPIYQAATHSHEAAHILHNKKDLLETDRSPGSYMAVERNWTSEKIGHFAFTATLANYYLHLKEQGVSTIKYNDGLEMSLDEILNGVKGLREIVTEKGFDLNKPESLIKLAKCSSDEWNRTYKNPYIKKQFKNVAAEHYTTLDIMDQIQIARDQNTRLNQMGEDLPIGFNMTINLPQEARSLMFATHEEIADIVENSTAEDDFCFSLSKEGLLAIDTYMSQKGLKTDTDKAEWLKKEFSKIVNRTKDADKTLEALFLNAGKEKTVCYTDNLQAKYQVSANGKTDMSQAELFSYDNDGNIINFGKIELVEPMGNQNSDKNTYHMLNFFTIANNQVTK